MFWQEYALITGEPDEGRVIEHARFRTRERGIYLGLPMGVVREKGSRHLLENKVVWIAPDGRILASYIKSYTAPWETSSSPVKKVAVFNAGSAIVGTAICFDMDFPSLMSRSGGYDVGLMLVPSYDWRGISPFHSHMAMFRSVENGFSLVRAAGESGVSIPSDPYGRVLSYLDNTCSEDKIMTTEDPVFHVKTIYSVIGDLFAWVSVFGLAILSFSRRRT